MAKEATFEVKGTIMEIKPNDQFIVKVEHNGKEKEIMATLSGSIRRFRIRITRGDRVTVCMTPYDLNRGRITFRDREVRK